ncbi:MAG TPA: hypothetical protein VHN12_09375, partial [Geobacteraceae bacterium]|nr:hypothetical protein [Geobacteraceae bacterium]
MSGNYCIGTICFVPLDASSPKFFGFSEFLAGLAFSCYGLQIQWSLRRKTADRKADRHSSR